LLYLIYLDFKKKVPSPEGEGQDEGKHIRAVRMKELARKLRYNFTDAELKLWRAIRNRQIKNEKFRRQHIIGPFIVDFICPEKRLIIELDGGQHNEQISDDQERTLFLEKQGFTVLRFWNNQVFNEFESVLEKIHQSL
jgi:very-short-patch-repair endonuclease